MAFIAVFMLAFVGGMVFRRLQIPVGQLIGALFVTALLNIFVGEVTYSQEVKFMSRVFSGILIGLRIKQEDVANLKQMYRPLLLLTLGMVVYATGLGFFVHYFGGVDLTTALFACVPGGLSDISLVAEEFGANMPQVAMIQMVRLLAVMLLYPTLVSKVLGKEQGKTQKLKKKMNYAVTEEQILEGVRTFVIAGLGSYVLGSLHVPAGELIGAILMTMLLRLRFHRGYCYPPAVIVIQTVVGVIIGSSVDRETVGGLLEIFPVTLISVIFIMAFGYFMGKAVEKQCNVDPATGLLSAAPGGVQEMILMCDSLGGQVSFVTTMQVFRVLLVVTVFPFWVEFLLFLSEVLT